MAEAHPGLRLLRQQCTAACCNAKNGTAQQHFALGIAGSSTCARAQQMYLVAFLASEGVTYRP